MSIYDTKISENLSPGFKNKVVLKIQLKYKSDAECLTEPFFLNYDVSDLLWKFCLEMIDVMIIYDEGCIENVIFC